VDWNRLGLTYAAARNTSRLENIWSSNENKRCSMTLNPPRTFNTRRLILRKPVFDDAPAVFRAYANDPGVTRYITWPPARSISDTEIAMRELLAAWESGIEYSWALILKDTNQLIGMISIRPSGFRIDLGYVLGRQFWGKGYMTEAGAVMIEWLSPSLTFFELGPHAM
jgi:[ribosomal protein S5]-alanine N-acetyltransferase